jgi:hypothetical protein
MSSRLETMVAYLAGQEGDEAEQFCVALADPTSEASQFLSATQQLSRNLFGDHALRWLGVSPALAGVEVLAAGPPASRGARSRLVGAVPWLLAGTACLLASLFWLDCRAHRAPAGPAAVASLARNEPPEPAAPAGEPGLARALALPRPDDADREALLEEAWMHIALLENELEQERAKSTPVVKDLQGSAARLSADLKAATARVALLEGQQEPLRAELAGLAARHKAAEDKAARLAGDLKNARGEVTRLAAQHQETLAGMARLEGDLKAARDGANRVQAELQASRDQVARLRADLKKARREAKQQRSSRREAR